MSAQGGSATNVVRLDAAGRREARIVAAARVSSIDYRSIVDNAVAGLTHNTPDARREVYAQARGIVKRHLQLMRLPEPIVEVEKLALDITIRKIERQWRSWQAAEAAIPDPELPAAPKVVRVTAGQAVGSLGQAVGALGQALASLLIVLGLRPILNVIRFLMWPLRFLLSPLSLAAAVPILAVAIFFIFFDDNNAAYKGLVDGRAAQWLSRLDLSHLDLSRLDIVSSAPAPRTRTKSSERAPSVAEPAPSRAREGARLADVRSTTTAVRAATADGAPMPAPTRVRPVPAELAPVSVASAAPASEVQAASTACGSGLSMAERLACAATDMNQDAEPAPPKAAQKTKPISPSAQSWIGKYAAMNGVALGLPTTPQSEDTPPSGEDSSMVAALPATPPSSAAETDEPAPTITGPGDPPRGTAPPPRVNLIRPANAKVTAMIDSGRRAAAKGDLDRAVHDFTEAIRLDPKYPDGYSERGQANFKLGETDRAIADYTAAIQRDPQHGTALRSRGMAYLYRGTSDLALADLTKAIELAENDPTMMSPIELFYARRSRASILGTKQQYDREVEDYSSLIASYMSDPTVVDALKSNYGDVGAANILATVYRQRATAHIRRQNWDLAIADLTAAIPLGSDRGYTALVDRAKIYEGLGKRDQAVADLQDALAVRPGSEEARLALRRLGAASRPAASARGL